MRDDPKGGITMTMKLTKLLLAGYLLASANTTMAAADHLKCYKAREVEGPGRLTATANLVSGIGLATENGCLIRGPSRLLCAPVEKLGLPPGGGPTGATTKFVCYKLKCPKQALQNVTAKDQFGTHVFVLRFPTTFCAPASPSGAFLEASSGF